MSLVNLAQEKNAVEFKTSLEEKLQAKVKDILESTKIEIAQTLFSEELIIECSHDWKGEGKCPKCVAEKAKK